MVLKCVSYKWCYRNWNKWKFIEVRVKSGKRRMWQNFPIKIQNYFVYLCNMRPSVIIKQNHFPRCFSLLRLNSSLKIISLQAHLRLISNKCCNSIFLNFFGWPDQGSLFKLKFPNFSKPLIPFFTRFISYAFSPKAEQIILAASAAFFLIQMQKECSGLICFLLAVTVNIANFW